MDVQREVIIETAIVIKKEMLMSLDKFRQELLSEVKALVVNREPFEKKWMKSIEVKKLLGLSSGKLQTMRNTGVIRFSKIGGTLYYDRNDIVQMLEHGRVIRRDRG